MAIPKFKTRATDALAVYEIIRRLSTPFEDTEAFEMGLIDGDGKFLKKRREMTREEKKSLTKFDVMIFNIKKMLQKLPGGDSKLRNFATALFLLKEEVSTFDTITEKEIQYLAEELEDNGSKTLKDLQEEVAISNSIGAGTIDPSVVPVDNRKKKKKCSKFGKCMVFEVDTDTFMKIRSEKRPHENYDKYLKDDHLESVRYYSRKNPGKSIMISDNKTGAMQLLKLGKNERW